MSWIKRLLGITELEEKVKRLDDQVIRLRQEKNSVRLELLNAEDRIKRMESMVQVGVDVHYRGRSWAVVCIAGKAEYVQFIDLGHADAREIKRFVGQFARQNVCVDSPPNMFYIFNEDYGKRKA